MTPLEQLTHCRSCARDFNATSSVAALPPKPQPRLQDICPCYRPKF